MKTFCLKCKVHPPEAGATFCSFCGEELVEPPPKEICPECNNLVSASANFCPYCRHDFRADKAVPA
jgi:predicted amidophosphoribosyltransferase